MVQSAEQCGYTVIDGDGEDAPCDLPATGWRWYQNVADHEDMLDAACELHENEGGRRIHDAEAERDQAKAEVQRLLEKLRRFRRKYGQPAPAVTPTETQAEDGARCRDCGAPWVPVRRQECIRCGSDSGPAPVADPTTGETR